MSVCLHTDTLGMWEGNVRVERCTICCEVVSVERCPDCTTRAEWDGYGRAFVAVRCDAHQLPRCAHCNLRITGTPVHDATEVAEMGARGLPVRAWCSWDHREASAERMSAGI